MATSSLIEPLKKDEDPERWLQRFKAVAAWQNWTGDDKRNAFLALIGADGYNLLADAVIPHTPADNTFDELTQLLTAQIQPKKLAIAARFDFSRLKQESDESVLKYIRKLRCAAEDCQFGTQLEDRLRDQLVFGIRSTEALQKMLTEKLDVLTLKKATEIALAHEAVQENQQSWKGSLSGATADVCRVKMDHIAKRNYSKTKGKKQQRQSSMCKCCGKPNHQKKDCRYRHVISVRKRDIFKPYVEIVIIKKNKERKLG